MTATLRNVVDGIADESIRPSDRDEALDGDVPREIELEVALEIEDEKPSLELELE